MLSGFDRRKGTTNPFLESGNEPNNPSSVSFSIPISFKRKYTRLQAALLWFPSVATLVGSMVHWPRSRLFLFIFSFFTKPFWFKKVSCIDGKKWRIHIQIVTSRMCPLHVAPRTLLRRSSVCTVRKLSRGGSGVKALLGERRTLERINGPGTS